MYNIRVFFLLLTIPFCMASCNNDEPTPIELGLKSQKIIEANNSFGFNFFEAILSSDKTDINLMVSPLSVSQAFSMALNGASENTFMEMNSALDFESFLLSEINESNQEIANSLISHDKKVKVEIANSIWYRNDFSPKSEFINNNSTFYNAQVNQYNPDQPNKAIDEINKWVKDKTHGKIDQIINELTSEDVLLLINAVYFKAEWKTKFKKSSTELMDFTCDNDNKKEVLTMKGEVELTYKNESTYSVIKLPYGSGKFNMLIYLPEEGYTTFDIASELKKTDFEYLNTMQATEMEICLPKFEFSYENELIDEIKALGINDAFDSNKANFSMLSNDAVFISGVSHKTYIKTDEEGSEATAATKVTFGMTSVGPGEIIRINRSFLFAIVEEDTNSMLFIGRVFDPSIN